MKAGFVAIDTTGYPIGFIDHLMPWLDMLGGLGVTHEFDDDGICRLYNPSHDLLARVHKFEIGF